MQYRAEIDGLRAVAVVPVILFHAGVSGFAGGYVGVDVFFVISGYLITSLIVSDLDGSRFSVAEFYARRARRILPALVTVVLACLPFALVWMSPTRLVEFSESITSVGLFISNLYFAGQEGYFAAAAEQRPLLHTWSLAVEEQYYLLFPVLMALWWRFARSWITAGVAVVAAASFAAAEWSVRNVDEGTFFLPHLRVWELLIGALTALYLRRRDRLQGDLGGAVALIGLALISIAVLALDAQTPFPSSWALLPTVGTGMVILGATPMNLAGQLLSRPLLVGIGLISYSAYLWHYPVFAFARLRAREEPSELLLVALGTASLGLAWLTWRFVENPCRDRQRLPRRRAIALGGVVSVLLIAVGVAGQVGDGFPQRLNDEQLAAHQRLIEATDDSPFDDGACRFSATSVNGAFVDRFERCVDRHGAAVLVTGDSHGADLFNALAVNAEVPFVVAVWKGFCRVHSELPRCHYRDLEEFLSGHAEHVNAVLYTQKGSYFLEGFENLPINLGYVRAVQDWLRDLDFDGEVLWVGPQMEPGVDLRNMNPMVHRPRSEDASLERSSLRELDRYLQSTNPKAGIEYVSKIDLVDYQFERDFVIADEYTHSDTDHWSPAGERVFGRRMLRDPRLDRLLGRQ